MYLPKKWPPTTFDINDVMRGGGGGGGGVYNEMTLSFPKIVWRRPLNRNDIYFNLTMHAHGDAVCKDIKNSSNPC